MRQWSLHDMQVLQDAVDELVADEIDAALDNVNVNKVSSYIRNRVDSPGSNFQAIVISLKDAFYGKADGLVGIYREKDVSKTVTMDLTGYDDVPA